MRSQVQGAVGEGVDPIEGEVERGGGGRDRPHPGVGRLVDVVQERAERGDMGVGEAGVAREVVGVVVRGPGPDETLELAHGHQQDAVTADRGLRRRRAGGRTPRSAARAAVPRARRTGAARRRTPACPRASRSAPARSRGRRGRRASAPHVEDADVAGQLEAVGHQVGGDHRGEPEGVLVEVHPGVQAPRLLERRPVGAVAAGC